MILDTKQSKNKVFSDQKFDIKKFTSTSSKELTT